MSDSYLLIRGSTARRIIRNVYAIVRHKYRRRPLWSLVGDITGHGSGYSAEICRSAGLEPGQLCGPEELKDTARETEEKV